MKILKFDLDMAKVVVELSRSEVGEINGLMFQAKEIGTLRAHIFLLYDILSHGVFDEFALDTARNILIGNINGMCGEEADNG